MNNLFAGIPVKDYESSLQWYEKFLGEKPEFYPHETEAVWELSENKYIFIVQIEAKAGNALVTFFVEDLEYFYSETSKKMIIPSSDEHYPNNVRKLTYHDPDGNEIGVCSTDNS